MAAGVPGRHRPDPVRAPGSQRDLPPHRLRRETTIGYPPPWPALLGLLYRGVYASGPGPSTSTTSSSRSQWSRPRSGSRTSWPPPCTAWAPRRRRAGAPGPSCSSTPWCLRRGRLGPDRRRRRALRGGGPGRWSRRGGGELRGAAGAGHLRQADAVAHRARRARLAFAKAPRATRLRRRLRGGVVLFAIVPFLVLGWALDPICGTPNTHFPLDGALSPTTMYRLFHDSLPLTGHWWIVGLLWVPALVAGLAAPAPRRADSTIWSRPRRALPHLLPHAHLALGAERRPRAGARADPRRARALDRRAFTVLWVIPLVFTISTLSAPTALGGLPGRHDEWRWPRPARDELLLTVTSPWSSSGRSSDGGPCVAASAARPGAPSRRGGGVNPATALPVGLALRIADEAAGGHATAPGRPGGCRRGSCCLDDEHDLAEEGVGFGVPILKRGAGRSSREGWSSPREADGPWG